MKRISIGWLLAGVASASACDLCAIYNVHAASGTRNKGFSVSLTEQFTHFGTLQEDGHEVRNLGHQYLNSAISQGVLGYTFNDWVTLQLNVPVIHREFKRPEGASFRSDHESGLGDVSLTAHVTPLRFEQKNSTFTWTLLGGIKLPTGDSDRLQEEAEESHHSEHDEHGIESGVHGHDLALGSGSVDGIIGTAVYARYHRTFFQASMQYAIRTRGDFNYRYANDLMWSGGPGVLLVLNEAWTASLQFYVSGEDKGFDEFRGAKSADTAVTSVLVGPQFNVTWSDKFSAQLGGDLPLLLGNSARQIVPDYRVRGAFTWHF